MGGNPKNADALNKIQTLLEYRFKNEELLRTALTHRSYVNELKGEQVAHNERLEFLGDAVLELVTSEFLYHKNEEMEEGDMSKTRASLVCEQMLSFCADKIQLGSFVFLGKGEDTSGGRRRASILSDAMEAIIGAIYLDGGYDSAKAFIMKYILCDIKNAGVFTDSKTKLQEIVQNTYKKQLSYRLISEEGPAHDKTFTVQAMMGEEPLEIGSGKSKKSATQDAAYRSILRLENTSGGKQCI